MRTEKLDALLGDGSEFKQRDHLKPDILISNKYPRCVIRTPHYQLEYSYPIPAAYARPQPCPALTVLASDPDDTYCSGKAYTLSAGADRM